MGQSLIIISGGEKGRNRGESENICVCVDYVLKDRADCKRDAGKLGTGIGEEGDERD